ncbi:MAG: Flp pilus assembly complex ATPase component TadA [Sandaracinaceae bacterium]|nr:Flp pilus assembly complex ATPase component TadA [Sandaracinaceae bacterium]
MLAIDSLLQLAHREGATELRVGTDRAPAMLGSKRQLSMPVTPDDMLRHLLGGLLTEANEARLERHETVELRHDVPNVGTTLAQLRRRDDGGLDATFRLLPQTTRLEAIAPEPVIAPTRAERRKPSTAPSSRSARREASPQSEATEATPTGSVAEHDGDGTRDRGRDAPREPEAEPHLAPRLRELWDLARARGASDLHLRERERPTLRIHGVLQPLDETPLEATELLSLFDARERVEIAGGVSVDLAHRAEDGARVRVNAYRSASGLALACRFLPRVAPTLEGLGARALADLTSLPNGLVVITGPTGSGKSSTLAAIARALLASRSVVLVSLEDPIEFELDAHTADEPPRGGRAPRSLVRQRQIGRDVRDFSTGLRDALREDPDVLVVGEMRDAESAALAMTAAETGHLVLTTLHARSAASAIDRIIDTQPEAHRGMLRAQLADSLRAVVAQRLVPRIGGGRVLALEVLRATAAVTSALREGRSGAALSAMQTGRQTGMVTLERSLADLVRSSTITLEAAEAHANDRDMLHRHLA